MRSQEVCDSRPRMRPMTGRRRCAEPLPRAQGSARLRPAHSSEQSEPARSLYSDAGTGIQRDVKKATLAHERGHRMNIQLRTRPPDADEHRLLFLHLYDVWESLGGKVIADQQVVSESGRKGI